MPSFIKLSAILLPAVLLAAGSAASSAAAQDRCEGTLCDLYYGNTAAPTPGTATQQQPAATPMTVPSGGILGFFTGNRAATPSAPGTAASGTAASGAPARAPLVQVQGGGLVGLAKGTSPERCEGTLCDLYYGGPPPEKPPQPARAATPTTTMDAAESDDAAPRPTRVRRATAPGVQYEKPHCAATAADPWKCYR